MNIANVKKLGITKQAAPKDRAQTYRTLLIVALALAFLAWLSREPLLDFLAFIANRDAFSAYIRSFGLLAPFVLSLLQIIQVLVALFPGYAFYIGAGYIYGLPLGYLLNLITTLLASQIAFGIARYLGRPVVDRLAPSDVVDHWDRIAKKHGFFFFLTSFWLPIFPADTMNYVAGLSSISGKKFLLASTLGRMPSVFLMTLLGSHAAELAELHLPWWIWLLVAAGSLLIYIAWQKLFQHLVPERYRS